MSSIAIVALVVAVMVLPVLVWVGVTIMRGHEQTKKDIEKAVGPGLTELRVLADAAERNRHLLDEFLGNLSHGVGRRTGTRSVDIITLIALTAEERGSKGFTSRDVMSVGKRLNIPLEITTVTNWMTKMSKSGLLSIVGHHKHYRVFVAVLRPVGGRNTPQEKPAVKLVTK